MDETDEMKNKMAEEMKRANPDKKFAEQIDRLSPGEIASLYFRLRTEGKK